MRKSILFVIDSLHCAGAEKSLTTLLSLLDYSKYDVDLQLFGYGGDLEKVLPKEVNLLEPLSYTNFAAMSVKDSLIYSIKNMNIDMFISRIKYSMKIRKNDYSNAQKARVYWQSCSKCIYNSNKKYDIAISYAQGVPTFYVAEKVNADKKFAWVNASYRLEEEDRKFQQLYYDRYNKIIAVSDSAKEILSDTFPKYKYNIEVIYDINSSKLINKMSEYGESYNDNFVGTKILTIGRLCYSKGYDIALEACKILKEKGINFKWYIMGGGTLESEIKDFIKDNKLDEYVILIGVKSNPYPYIKDCDIYVQTSKSEGFGIAIAEARMLNKPVVTTRFDAVYNQMVDGKNGLVVDMNGKAVSDGIMELINNQDLKNNIINYLGHEKKGNEEELDKFYKLIEE
ncbi:glycosyltransferase [Intestinibacter bartlettii]|jgi:glycosyltransferase involved in cell wall biosynthesis|uniref:glycosyltransferase n=1 Tax=Intestinibacter bartlettii TaxID=261299 RepID=UPI0026DC1848|nr:glycosyltransferase [Intestinibacter bartlettii]